MMFAHTTVELPKYGASRREAAISVARIPPPARKTTSSSRRANVTRDGISQRLKLPRDPERRRPHGRAVVQVGSLSVSRPDVPRVHAALHPIPAALPLPRILEAERRLRRPDAQNLPGGGGATRRLHD